MTAAMPSPIAVCPGCAAGAMTPRVQVDGLPTHQLSLPTIHCAACISKVERALHRVPGVQSARVNLSLKRVAVQADDSVVHEDLTAALARIGYEAYPLEASVLAQDADPVGRALLLRLAVAGFAMMNIMLLSVAVWSGASDATRDLFHLISGVIAVPVVAFSAQPFFANAWRALRVWGLNMDVPISLAIVLAVAMSLFETLQSGAHAYFDAAVSLTFFLLIGRYLDHRSRAAARSAAQELTALESHTADRVDSADVVKVAVSDLCVGDIVQVPTGMRVPVDGALLSPQAVLDRSFLTGESAAVDQTEGAILQAGEVNLGAPLRLKAIAVGEDTTLRRMAAMVGLAEASRNRYTALADRAARIYAPAVHLLALLAFVGWIAATGDARLALNIAVAVLIITCPCALGLAVPAVATAAIGRLFAGGFLVKHATALERIAEVDMVVLDKTGTLTRSGVAPDLAALSKAQKSVALALAQASHHPVAVAIAGALRRQIEPAALDNVAEWPGCGVEAWRDGTRVRLGKADWLGMQATGTALDCGDGDLVDIEMVEQMRPGVRTAIAGLKQAGLEVQLLTGDHAGAAGRIGVQLGIDTVIANVSPEQKHAHLSALADAGRRVLMVGDGLNDTGALAVAHASVAPASALDAARSAADIVVLKDDFAALPDVIKMARAAQRLSRQNFAIAAGYNAVAIPVALAGLASPLLAALAMSASSVTVLANAVRVRRAA